MKRILKWNVRIDDKPHEIGQGRVVHVDCQDFHNSVQVWTEEWEGMEGKTRAAKVVGTGRPFNESGECVGSVVTAGGALVWHVVVFR